MIEMNGPSEVDRVIEALFEEDEVTPCSECSAKLRHFAETRPKDFEYIQRQDLVDLRTASFIGIPEWDAFAERYGTCELCNA